MNDELHVFCRRSFLDKVRDGIAVLILACLFLLLIAGLVVYAVVTVNRYFGVPAFVTIVTMILIPCSLAPVAGAWFIRSIVRRLNRRDDPRHAKPPDLPP